MNKLKKIILFISLLIIAGCENEHVVDVDVAFTEYTVVQAELREDENFPGVRFTKTLPLGIPYSIELAEIKDITAYIRINGVQIIPLFYNSEGLYNSIHQFRISSGSTYELFAMRGDTFIYGKTYIPVEPTIDQTRFNQNNNAIEADVYSYENEVYAAIWKISTSIEIRADDFYSVAVPETIYENSTVQVRTASIPEEYLASAYNGNRYLQVYSFDKSFKAYFNSRTSGGSIDDPFIQGGGSLEWNVQGNNVIGLFIGVGVGIPIFIN
ncbi:hypothetical protein ACFLSS_04060 [Bacteroidota bacterium]